MFSWLCKTVFYLLVTEFIIFILIFSEKQYKYLNEYGLFGCMYYFGLLFVVRCCCLLAYSLLSFFLRYV